MPCPAATAPAGKNNGMDCIEPEVSGRSNQTSRREAVKSCV